MDYLKVLNKEIVKRKINSVKGIIRLREELAKELHPKQLPSLITIFAKANKEQKLYLKKILKTKPGRTLSGVAPVAVMTMPSNCPPQAKCIYCPGGLRSQFGDTPKSYTGNEPASMRARRNNYDPYLQIFNRLEHYILLNQDVSKCEVIVMGGTFTSFAKSYQKEFVKYIFKAMNDFSKLFFKGKKFDYDKFSKFFELDQEFKDPKRTKKINEKVLKLKGKCDLKKEQLKNEKSNCRIIGLTLETRPDCVDKEIGNFMLNLGATRVELGIQSTDDKVLDFVKRGHGTKESKNSIKLLKNLGFKLNLHYMLFFNTKKQLEDAKKLFSDEGYKPDMLKIYPCMIFPGTELYELFRKKKYKGVTTKQAAKIISEFKRSVERYCRIMRVQRDIPPKLSKGGVDRSNLRQYVDVLCKKNKIDCKCIRCKEIGRNQKVIDNRIYVDEYDASGSKEFFISIGKDPLVGFVRLRFPSEFLRKEITQDSAMIRELHVYSSAIKVGSKGDGYQHKGYGKILMDKAEEICKKHGKKKLLVISGIGVKDYYISKLGYKKDGIYVSKKLK
tara:strand:- start:1704 stop:3374 length:1671 start_codon:yes stop_codon:yes gene_type:complete